MYSQDYFCLIRFWRTQQWDGLKAQPMSLTNRVFPKLHDGYMHVYKITTFQLFSLWLFYLSNISNNWRLWMPHGINKLFLLISRMVASFYFLRIVNVCYSCFVFALKVNKSKYFLSLFFWSLNFPRNCKEATILIHWEKVFLFCKLTKKKNSEDFFFKFFWIISGNWQHKKNHLPK